MTAADEVRMEEDRRDPGREVLVKAGRCDRDHHRSRSGRNDHQVHVVAFVLDLGQRADAAGCNRAEEHDAGAAENRGHVILMSKAFYFVRTFQKSIEQCSFLKFNPFNPFFQIEPFDLSDP